MATLRVLNLQADDKITIWNGNNVVWESFGDAYRAGGWKNYIDIPVPVRGISEESLIIRNTGRTLSSYDGSSMLTEGEDYSVTDHIASYPVKMEPGGVIAGHHILMSDIVEFEDAS
jgi:hypothetical protein